MNTVGADQYVALYAGPVVALCPGDVGILSDRGNPGIEAKLAWLQAIGRIAAEVLGQIGPGDRVTAVGVSGQQHGFVPLDANDQVIRPAKLWCDTATAAEARELSERLGRPVPTGFTASKVLWMARHEPERWARVRTVLLPHDYINLLLTGRPSTEAGDASGTGWFDPRRRASSPRKTIP